MEQPRKDFAYRIKDLFLEGLEEIHVMSQALVKTVMLGAASVYAVASVKRLCEEQTRFRKSLENIDERHGYAYSFGAVFGSYVAATHFFPLGPEHFNQIMKGDLVGLIPIITQPISLAYEKTVVPLFNTLKRE